MPNSSRTHVAGISAALFFLLFLNACRSPTPSSDTSESIRSLDEWRQLSEGWATQVARVCPRESQEFKNFSARYIEASATANSLINQIQFDAVANLPFSQERYALTVQRARVASDALTEYGKTILLSAADNTASRPRGTATTNGDEIATKANMSVSLAGQLMDIVMKYRRATSDSDAAQREKIKKELDQRKWRNLDELLKQR